MSAHLYISESQPATRFLDANLDPPLEVVLNPRRVLTCWSCGRRRWAANLEVRVYYDCVQFFCAGGRCRKKR